jgi:hypothetical protein
MGSRSSGSEQPSRTTPFKPSKSLIRYTGSQTIHDSFSFSAQISDHQQSWEYEEGPSKGAGATLCWWSLINSNHKPPESYKFR